MAQGEKKESEVIDPEQDWNRYYKKSHTNLTEEIGQLKTLARLPDAVIHPSWVRDAFDSIRRSRENENMLYQKLSNLEALVTDLTTCIAELNKKVKKYESYEPMLDELQREHQMHDRSLPHE